MAQESPGTPPGAGGTHQPASLCWSLPRGFTICQGRSEAEHDRSRTHSFTPCATCCPSQGFSTLAAHQNHLAASALPPGHFIYWLRMDLGNKHVWKAPQQDPNEQLGLRNTLQTANSLRACSLTTAHLGMDCNAWFTAPGKYCWGEWGITTTKGHLLSRDHQCFCQSSSMFIHPPI